MWTIVMKFWGLTGQDSKERILLVQERWIGCGRWSGNASTSLVEELTVRFRFILYSGLKCQDPKTRYPVVVRFSKVNYANISTNNYALDEIEEVKWETWFISKLVRLFVILNQTICTKKFTNNSSSSFTISISISRYAFSEPRLIANSK